MRQQQLRFWGIEPGSNEFGGIEFRRIEFRGRRVRRRPCQHVSDGLGDGHGHQHQGRDVKASLLGTIKRTDGTTQVTYNKHPLYYYSGDSQAGQQNGQGLNAFGALWYVVAPAGGPMI